MTMESAQEVCCLHGGVPKDMLTVKGELGIALSGCDPPDGHRVSARADSSRLPSGGCVP